MGVHTPAQINVISREFMGDRVQNQVRIISGSLRGSKLKFANAEGLRPTSDRVRETVFNWLATDIVGARCLDLFTGSGALAVEAYSRGADNVLALEKNSVVASVLKNELERLAVSSIRLEVTDAINWLESRHKMSFDLVFIDPPFSENLMSDVVLGLENNDLLADDAKVYLEMPLTSELPKLPVNWSIKKDKQAGNVRYILCDRKVLSED